MTYGGVCRSVGRRGRLERAGLAWISGRGGQNHDEPGIFIGHANNKPFLETKITPKGREHAGGGGDAGEIFVEILCLGRRVCFYSRLMRREVSLNLCTVNRRINPVLVASISKQGGKPLASLVRGFLRYMCRTYYPLAAGSLEAAENLERFRIWHRGGIFGIVLRLESAHPSKDFPRYFLFGVPRQDTNFPDTNFPPSQQSRR